MLHLILTGVLLLTSKKKNNTAAVLENTPHIIKSSRDITEFTVDKVNIAPGVSPITEVKEWIYNEEIDDDEEVPTGRFIGVYTADTTIPKDNLYISGNKFYYSDGTTTIKGLRGYFWVSGFASSPVSAAPAIRMEVDGEATNIEGLQVIIDDGTFYNLKGQKVSTPNEKGIYIRNGKKVVIK